MAGGASVLPVIAQQPGWVEVRLAQRPNGSIAWVPAADVSLATDPYHIVINLGTMHLQLFNHGQEVANFPAGSASPPIPHRPEPFSWPCSLSHHHPATAPS